MKLNLKSLFGIKQKATEKTVIEEEIIELNKHLDFYYTNLINSIILFYYDSIELNKTAPILLYST